MKKIVKKSKPVKAVSAKPETIISAAEELFIPPVKSDRCLNCGQREINHFFYTRQCKPHSDARFKDMP